MLEQNITTPLNEDTMMHAVVGLEKYIDMCREQEIEPSSAIIDAHKVLNKIWFEMHIDQDYYLFSEPF